ncbi:methylmalonyl-CoA epimerase, mitochondrial-like isoform X2 [Gigantopelta aegis]|uniref:methylmalonyl-CoA epimerase, mitochondrial-like isoform X2 n=1 Tax=Gigantopelta aegis TaxID=1735272 RepID=UPI001B888629|nr:methylmalonyl-CoA epimerase, mitochondrial-like isoform X2 [Gigantopelta aegis]
MLVSRISAQLRPLLLHSFRGIHASHSAAAAWKIGNLNHVAIACPDLEKATSLYRDILGAKVSEKQALHDHGVYVVFVQLGEAKIELLHPLGDKSPIQKFLQRNKNGGVHHICIEVRSDHVIGFKVHIQSKLLERTRRGRSIYIHSAQYLPG